MLISTELNGDAKVPFLTSFLWVYCEQTATSDGLSLASISPTALGHFLKIT